MLYFQMEDEMEVLINSLNNVMRDEKEVNKIPQEPRNVICSESSIPQEPRKVTYS